MKCPECGIEYDDLYFSDRMVRDHLIGKEVPLFIISQQLKMDKHSVLESLLKLYKNGEVDYHKSKSGMPCFFTVVTKLGIASDIGEKKNEV